ncbi:MAG: divalent cation tolerance protein CutA [Chitinivibrionales bacterium]|nr:divalent cation tolerance protein CutA [Chitinivibrionales bacterium]
MSTTDLRFVYMTAGSKDEATRIGKMLVQERLAACVNIVDNMTSLYWWEEEVQSDTETVCIAKTTSANASALIEKVKSLHSYTTPCIVTLPILEGNARYLDWLRNETR